MNPTAALSHPIQIHSVSVPSPLLPIRRPHAPPACAAGPVWPAGQPASPAPASR
ncbi:hypothetical protein U9M48_000720 [Paspalum notatum var. saurae]|uniref:Uncharacterized protein n=1 Tax=Paspalum notatum var. saurae TaxID=547442 RepID=A0AAQ3SIB5_PASNO